MARCLLMVAASRGHAECIAPLLNGGASVDAKTNRGVTALMWAASKGHAECIAPLLNGGASVDARDRQPRRDGADTCGA